MLEIQRALKRIIDRFIAKMIPLTADASAGSNTIYVQSTRRFLPGDNVVVRTQNSADAELHCIASIPDHRTLVFQDTLIRDYQATIDIVQKLVGYQAGNEEFLVATYIGDPAVIADFPAITIDAKSRSSEWFTLESTKETYDIDITVYVDGSTHYETQYELMMYYVAEIERSLFRSFYPLVRPYNSTTLAEDVQPEDDFIKVVDNEFYQCGMGWIFLESVDYVIPNRAEENLGSGILQLIRPVGRSFSAGDTVIHPLRHIFNTLPASTRYGFVNKNTILKAAVISFKAEEEVRRFQPFVDPLSF